MLQRFVHHEISETLAESIGQFRREVIIRGIDREHILGKFAKALFEIRNNVPGRTADRRDGELLLPHGANDQQAVVEIGDRKNRLRPRSTQLVDQWRRVGDPERIGVVHDDFDIGGFGAGAQAVSLGGAIRRILVHDGDLFDLAPAACAIAAV